MNNNSWFKKEKPMLTLPGLGGGSASNLYWSTGDGPSYTYVDDVFSMFLCSEAYLKVCSNIPKSMLNT